MKAHKNGLEASTLETTVSFWRSWPALVGLSAVFLFEMLDNSILNIALPTIGRELSASTTQLQWITSSYALVFGGLMLLFGALADKFGPRKMMLTGLTLLAFASLLTLFVQTPNQLIAVRVLIGIAAAMTTPLSMTLAFKLFEEDSLRIRAISIITTVGLVGLAIGPVVGGFVLAIAPWQALLVVNVPVAVLAIIGIRKGIKTDVKADLHNVPIDYVGAITGTLAIVSLLLAPTLFVERGFGSYIPWLTSIVAVGLILAFVYREKTAKHPLIDLKLVTKRLVSSGLAYNAASGLAIAGLGYMITLQLQLDWGFSPALSALAMLPQVITLLAVGPFIEKFVEHFGIHKAILIGALSILAGLMIFGTLGQLAYIWVAITLILTAAGLRIVGVIAGINVLKGVPENRSSAGAAMVDTSNEVSSAIGVAVSGTIIAAIFVGVISKTPWTSAQALQFHNSVSIITVVLSVVVASLIAWAYIRTRKVDFSNQNK